MFNTDQPPILGLGIKSILSQICVYNTEHLYVRPSSLTPSHFHQNPSPAARSSIARSLRLVIQVILDRIWEYIGSWKDGKKDGFGKQTWSRLENKELDNPL